MPLQLPSPWSTPVRDESNCVSLTHRLQVPSSALSTNQLHQLYIVQLHCSVHVQL